jgi:hypothetical protein
MLSKIAFGFFTRGIMPCGKSNRVYRNPRERGGKVITCGKNTMINMEAS